jgi:hypothetical protein
MLNCSIYFFLKVWLNFNGTRSFEMNWSIIFVVVLWIFSLLPNSGTIGNVLMW